MELVALKRLQTVKEVQVVKAAVAAERVS